MVIAERTMPVPVLSVEPVAWDGSRAEDALELADSLGIELDEHQRHVLEVGLRTLEGKWAAYEVAVVEPRQNGKTLILAIRAIAGVYRFGEELVTHSAHEFATSQEQFRTVEALIRSSEELLDQVKFRRGTHVGFKHSHGEESIELEDGRRIWFRTRTKAGGIGFSGDCLLFDEGQILREDSMTALMPTLRARRDRTESGPQVWYAATAVDRMRHEHGIILTRLRERAQSGDGEGLVYREWGLGLDDPMLLDEATMFDEDARRRSNPAYGIRISKEHFDRECRSQAMSTRAKAVDLFGVWDPPLTDPTAQGPIKVDRWLELVDVTSRLEKLECLSFDVSPERRASIACSGLNQHGGLHVEIPFAQPGTGWLAAKVAELVERHRPAVVRADGAAATAPLIEDVRALGVVIDDVSVTEHASACQRFVGLIEQGAITHLGSAELLDAIRGCATRSLGDGWLWSRKAASVDISPLVAATLAVDAAAQAPGGDLFRIF